ncbi:phosphodiesterase/alkaline phosphatase D [Nocardioides psychrotolerans]|uniref:Alkaline phosphatase D n=1 Tax=Nocardioides psychrotolerans TaxID=1005945 RepID=A0A1I3FR63_9ACTN|nr:alkaline phosphatase D family protein [Nocardioides psychrotolerans]GEP37270.1 phosphodiesterase/alkaline phosphatase D [Nocardioides psychrotolerans]SFI13723.1 alkaline phosphatase D [Nocardioides psychrotolerans]
MTTRRTVLASGAGASAAALTARATGPASSAGPANSADAGAARRVFTHGVASGDPLPQAVVIWTRVTPTPASKPGSGKGPQVAVRWEVARDAGFRHVVRRGVARTGPSRDHTVKVDVTGLTPATWFHYRFALTTVDGVVHSRTGRTRTAPAADSDPGHLRLGFASCSNFPEGFFAAYRGLAARDDLHAVVHLGDYLYESGTKKLRAHVPDHEIVSLADYRQRHAQYKTDPDLQDAHAKFPWIVTWDDHEVTNDAYRDGAENHTPGSGPDGEGSYARRRARAHRAYDEWMPARLDGTAALGDGTRLYRRIRFGRLAELSMLDLRTYRDQQVTQTGTDATVDDPDRTITGQAQLDWLTDGLDDGRAQWKLVGTSVMFAPLKVVALPRDVVAAINTLSPLLPEDGAYVNPDQWDGYTADRRTVIDHLQEAEVSDTVFLTGDIHSAWAMDVPVDAGSYPLTGSVAVEFVCTSVTSDNLKDALGTPPRSAPNLAAEQAIMAANQHIKYLNFDDHGFCVLDVTAERTQCDWFVIGSRADRRSPVRWTRSFRTLSGSSTVQEVDRPVS